jgi:phage baseplate assembly protein W
MGGYGPKLPLTVDATDGIELTKSLLAAVRQNLKMILLTVPGERVMLPKFGVGLKRYLFEQNTVRLRDDITLKINQQVSVYLPYIQIEKVKFSDLESPESEENKMKITVFYRVDMIGAADALIVEP